MEIKKENSLRVSVAMTTFNGSRFLNKQLDSILKQTYSVYEIVVCDDGSTDNTIAILKEYSSLTNLIIIQNESNVGFVKNFERSIAYTTGDLIVLADQDDIWYENKIETLVNCIGGNLLIHSDCDLIDNNDSIFLKKFKGEILSHTNAIDFLNVNVVTGCTVMFTKELKKLVLPFPENLAYHDWYLGIMAAYQSKIKYLPTSLQGYRQHPNQDTGAVRLNTSHLKSIIARALGKEFNGQIASKGQLKNLKALRANFSKDEDFQKKIDDMIYFYDDYLNNFFHFKCGKKRLEMFVGSNKNSIKRFFYFLKFSVG
jgi:glycosyltransferase involved in cell wall biosynthesis